MLPTFSVNFSILTPKKYTSTVGLLASGQLVQPTGQIYYQYSVRIHKLEILANIASK